MESTLQSIDTPDSQSAVAERNVNPKRKRLVPTRMSSDNCRNCKERKVKCDGERPVCRRCRSAGRDCKGFAIWEVQLHAPEQAWDVRLRAPEQATAVTHMPASVNESAANRTQLISNFLGQQYPRFKLAAPAAAHSPDRSFLHSLVESNMFSPMLQVAVETICLTHLANAGVVPSALQQQSYGRTLSLLRAALADCRLKSGRHSRKDVIATSAALSLLPTTGRPSGQGADGGEVEAGLHLCGAGEYLLEYGPSALGGGTKFNAGLLLNIHVHSLCVAFAQRKRIRWTRPEWTSFNKFDLRVEPPPNFPAVARYYPGGEVDAGFVWCAFSPREFMINYLHDFPGLLERADNFVAADTNTASREFLESELEDLVQKLNSMQRHSVEPILDSDTARKPAIMRLESELFDLQIEEHVFMKIDTTFDEFYEFADSDHGKSCTFIHLLCLLADCALLQVMCNGIAVKELCPSSADICLPEIEQRAYWHASEICRCTLFYTLRTLSGARYLYGMLCCARNFFQSYGALREMDWCQGCAVATRRRIERLEPIYPRMVCRVEDFVKKLPDGCRYKRFSHVQSAAP